MMLRHRVPRRCLPFLLVVSLAAGAARAQPAPEDTAGMTRRTYTLSHLQPQDAAQIVRMNVPSLGDDGQGQRVGAFKTETMAFVAVQGTPAEHDAVVRVLAERDVASPDQRFGIHVLDVFDEPQPAIDLPASAAKALQEVRTVFPFKGYRIRQAGLFQSTGRAHVDLGGEFVAVVQFDARRGKDAPIQFTEFALADAPAPGKTRRTYVETSFSMRPGETVVLGTSQGGGGPKALVILVTALP